MLLYKPQIMRTIKLKHLIQKAKGEKIKQFGRNKKWIGRRSIRVVWAMILLSQKQNR
jgi:hypothetical protein